MFRSVRGTFRYHAPRAFENRRQSDPTPRSSLCNQEEIQVAVTMTIMPMVTILMANILDLTAHLILTIKCYF